MLVVASMLIWGTQVSALQVIGYSIALGGMIYYKLGYDQIKGYTSEAGRRWAEFGANKPILRKLSIIILALFIFLALLGSFSGSAANYQQQATDALTKAANRVGAN